MRCAPLPARSARLALLALSAIAPGCSRVDGSPAPDATFGAQVCAFDHDCGAGRYCGPDGQCAIDCSAAKDCSYKLEDPSLPNTFSCSPCGRCLPPGRADLTCLDAAARPCQTDAACKASLGPDYTCGGANVCVRACAADDDCRSLGRGFSCGGGRCLRGCRSASDCALHGWAYACVPGAAPLAEDAPRLAAAAECLPQPGPPEGAASGQDMVGVWAWMVNTTVRTLGVPLINEQDTTSNQYALVKVTSDGATLTFHEKWCAIGYRDFHADDKPFKDIAPVSAPDRYVDHVPLLYNHAPVPASFAPGASFDTDRMLEVRGAILPDPASSPLPTRADPGTEVDEDEDGNPGMTLTLGGLLAGQIYHTLRWWVVYHVGVVDSDHVQGLIDTASEQNILGASDPGLVYDTQSAPYPQADRSYFRAERVPDGTSCADVIARSESPGWLFFDAHFDPAKAP